MKEYFDEIYNATETFNKRFNYDKEILALNIKCLDIRIAFYLYEYPNNKFIIPPFPSYKNETFTGLFNLHKKNLIEERINKELKPLNLTPTNNQEIKDTLIKKVETLILLNDISNLLLIDLCPNYFSIIRKNIFDNKIKFQASARYDDPNYKDIITFLIDKKHWITNIHNDNITYSSLAKELMGISELSRALIRDWRNNPNECKILNMRDAWKIENYIHFIGDNNELRDRI